MTWEVPSAALEGAAQSYFGYVELSDPDGDPPRIVTTLWSVSGEGGFAGLLSSSNEHPFDIGLVSPDDLTTIASLLGVSADSNRGTIMGTTYDCRFSVRSPGAGVTGEVSTADATTAYGYGLDPAARETGPTVLEGLYEVYNVPPGTATVTGRYDGQVVSTATVQVRAGAVTQLILRPTAAP